MSEEALTSFTVSDAYRYFVSRAWLIRSKIRSCTKYLMPTNNVIVLESHLI